MKLKKLNTVALAIPILILVTYPFFAEGALMLAALSTMATGFLQVVAGFWFWFENPKDKRIMAYLIAVAVYFALLFFTDLAHEVLIAIPPVLALYLSVLIYSRENHEL